MISMPVLAIALPFLGGVGVGELAIILVIVLILFGPKRLPQLGKTLGKTMKSIREGVEGKLDDDDDDAEATKKDAEVTKKAPKDEEAE